MELVPSELIHAIRVRAHELWHYPEQNHEQSTALVAAFDPGKRTKWDVETTGRHNCTAAAWTLVACYVICSWSNTTGVDDGNNLSRNVAVPYLIYYCFYVQLIFTTVFSWSLHQSTEAFFFFNLTVYLMPYLLLRFWTCLAEFAKSVYPFVFRPSVHEQKLTGH